MHKVRICLEVDGLAQDESRQPCPSGIQMEIGESEKEFPYEELTANINIPAILKAVCLDGIVAPENVRVITLEEYDQKYADC